jgi:hypothetical protein
MKTKRIIIKSLFLLIGFILINSFSFAQKPNPKKLPSISFTATKNVLVLDETKVNANIVKLDSEFNLMGTTKVSILWSISGVEGKDWKIISGTLNDKTIEIEFKKIGNYDVYIEGTYSFKLPIKKGEDEELEEDVAINEQEGFITVTNNLDELTQLFVDRDFLKLIKRADDFRVKPKYAEDPTPLIFLAKGYFALYLDDVKQTLVSDPYDEAINSLSEAIEMDQNGILNMPIHKMWLAKFQNEIFLQGILNRLDENDGYSVFKKLSDKNLKDIDKKEGIEENKAELIEGIEQSILITKNPNAYRFLEAAIRYNAKEIKEANAIYKAEIPNLNKLKNLDGYTETDLAALRIGIILSAQVLYLKDKDKSYKNACGIYNSVVQWFDTEEDFEDFFTNFLNSCSENPK